MPLYVRRHISPPLLCPASPYLSQPLPPGRAFELNAARSRQRRPAVPGDALRGLLARETAATGHLPAGHTRARADQATFALRGAHLALRGADAQFKRCRPLVRPSCARALPVGACGGRSRLARSLHAPGTCAGEAQRVWPRPRRSISAQNCARGAMARCQLSTRPNMALHEHPCARVRYVHCMLQPYPQVGCVQQRSGAPWPPPARRVHLCSRARHLNGASRPTFGACACSMRARGTRAHPPCP